MSTEKLTDKEIIIQQDQTIDTLGKMLINERKNLLKVVIIFMVILGLLALETVWLLLIK